VSASTLTLPGDRGDSEGLTTISLEKKFEMIDLRGHQTFWWGISLNKKEYVLRGKGQHHFYEKFREIERFCDQD